MGYRLHFAPHQGAPFLCGAEKRAARTTSDPAYFRSFGTSGYRCHACARLLLLALPPKEPPMGLYLDDKNRPRSQTSVSPSQNLPQTPPMPHGKRANAGKLRFSLLSSFALTGLVKVLEYGAEKYTERDEAGNVLVSGADNWRKGLSWKATVDSLMRHTLALMAGEDIDPESGLPHVHHMQCNTMFLAHFFETKTGSDDR